MGLEQLVAYGATAGAFVAVSVGGFFVIIKKFGIGSNGNGKTKEHALPFNPDEFRRQLASDIRTALNAHLLKSENLMLRYFPRQQHDDAES